MVYLESRVVFLIMNRGVMPMQIINKLLDRFFNVNPVVMFLVCLLVMYGGMFIVALIGESRIFRFGKYQAKAFFPGDIFVSLMIAGLCSARRRGPLITQTIFWRPSRSTWWIVASILIAVMIFGSARLGFDAPNYPRRAQISPTKLYHDMVGYLLMSFVLVQRGIPASLIFVTNFKKMRSAHIDWAIILISLVAYVVCVMYDDRRGFDNTVLELRHPSDWAPIWATWKIR